MKVVFICGCLESGKDGVGDYTVRLARHLASAGNPVLLIALNDSYIERTVELTDEISGIHKIRIAAGSDLLASAEMLKKKISEFDPDWISLQFVIFAYDKRGLPFNIGNTLGELCKGRKVQIMFHELWLGMERFPKPKYALWGLFQRRIISGIIRRINPIVIHTHCDWYQSCLRIFGKPVIKLPLYSNIPLPANYNKKVRYDFRKIASGESIVFLLFGHISPGAPLAYFLDELKALYPKSGNKITLRLAGQNHYEQQNWIDAWNKAGFKVEVLGQLKEAEVSDAIAMADIGIATTPLAVIEKSGSFNALIEHGLPVINVAARKDVDKFFPKQKPRGLYLYRKGNLTEILKSIEAPPIGDRSESSSIQFIEDLKNAEGKIKAEVK